MGRSSPYCKDMYSSLRHVSTIGKNLLSSNISPTCPYNKVNFDPLVADIVSLVWGTPANFNGFRVLSALLHGTLLVILLVSVSQTVALNRGRHLHLAGRPSRWALAHVKIIPFPRVGSLIAFPCFAYMWLSRFWLGLDLWRYGASLSYF